jgi:hypothetical protein
LLLAYLKSRPIVDRITKKQRFLPYFSDSHIPKGGTDVTDERSAVTSRKLTLRNLRWAAATDPQQSLSFKI